ncbi:MAG: DUF3078 domain-containing protein [Phaeodactylibacter sp.]|nr:DUF3078 domain-containing protein [Phaeodactylibacter sp.]
MKRLLLLFSIFCSLSILGAQVEEPPTTEELQALLATKAETLDSLNGQLKSLTKQVGALQKEVDALKDKVTPYPRWRAKLATTLGFNVSNYSDWLLRKPASLSSATIAAAGRVVLRLDQKRYFWKNGARVNLGWLKFDDKSNPEDDAGFQPTSDVFNAISMFGWRINKSLAFSSLTEYRTSMLNGRFNNPGYLDLGSVGLAWTPTPDFSAVLHSVNYNLVFSREEFDYKSSLGAKLVVDYEHVFAQSIAWKSNFSAFASYENLSELSNWMWSNNLSTGVKGFGIGLEFALRSNKQEARAFEVSGNPLQFFWVLGLSYNLSKKL